MEETPHIPLFLSENLPSKIFVHRPQGTFLTALRTTSFFHIAPFNYFFGILIDAWKENLSYEPKDSYFALNRIPYPLLNQTLVLIIRCASAIVVFYPT